MAQAFTPGGQRVSDTESFPNYDSCLHTCFEESRSAETTSGKTEKCMARCAIQTRDACSKNASTHLQTCMEAQKKVSDFETREGFKQKMKVVQEADALCKNHPLLRHETKDLCNAVDMQREH